MMPRQQAECPREMRRRSKLEIYLEVLSVIKDGMNKPTRIMYGANISWLTMKRILSSLVSGGLVREIDVSEDRDGRSSKRYEITQKGVNVVRYLNRFVELMEVDY